MVLLMLMWAGVAMGSWPCLPGYYLRSSSAADSTPATECKPCSKCPPGQVVLLPCQPHRDVRCAPLSALHIPWHYTFPADTTLEDLLVTSTQRFNHRKEDLLKTLKAGKDGGGRLEGGGGLQPDILEALLHHESHQAAQNRPQVTGFTPSESLVWDWQAVALASAVASCLLFFTVAALYTLLYARHWASLSISYHPGDQDEMSSKLALMSPGGDGSLEEANPQCPTGRYLHHLIAVQNPDERKVNEYINEKVGS